MNEYAENAVKQVGAVNEWVTRLENETERLQKATMLLAAKLESVTRDEPATPVTDSTEETQLVSLAARVRNATRAVSAAARQIEHVTRTCEL